MLITEPLPNQMLRPSLRYLAYILGQHWTSPLQEQSCLTSMSKMFTYIRLHYINDSLGLQPMLLIRSATSTASLSADMSSCLPSIHLSSHLSIYCWFFHPSICLSCLSVPSPFCLFMHSSFCPFIHPSIHPWYSYIHPFVCPSACHPSTSRSVLSSFSLFIDLSSSHRSFCPSVYPFDLQSVHPLFGPFISLSVYPTPSALCSIHPSSPYVWPLVYTSFESADLYSSNWSLAVFHVQQLLFGLSFSPASFLQSTIIQSHHSSIHPSIQPPICSLIHSFIYPYVHLYGRS